MNKENNLVVYTGSFCPPTKAHFALMKEAMKVVDATKGIFLPTCDDHIKSKMIEKMDPLSLSGEVRIKMLETFCRKNSNVSVCDYEIRVKDSNSTYKTFSYLQKENPLSTIYYVMGADKLKNLPHWKNCDKFLNNFKFIVFDRSDMNSLELIEKDSLLKNYKDNFVIVPPLEKLSFVSSSKVRKMFLDHDESYKNYLDDGVVEILENLNMDDYPPVDDYDFIHLKLGKGPHGITSACRRVYLMNKELFNNDKEYSNFSNIKLIDKVDNIKKEKKFETKINLVKKEYYELVNEYDNSLIISECSSTRVGHNYDQGGHDSLEEELCRISNLSNALYRFGNPKLKCVKEFDRFEKNIFPLSSPLFVEGIRIIRSGKRNDFRLIDTPVSTSVILVPSLNMKVLDKVNDIRYLVDFRVNEEGIKIMKDNLRKALLCALDNGFENIIINTFGSGFYIPLEDSFLIIKDMIKEFDGCFKNIVINNAKKKVINKYDLFK